MMTQIHQGVDIVEVNRFKKVFQRNSGFASDVFTEKERDYCESKKDPYVHFAGRFAAKEACLKALGMGLTTGIDNTLQEIEVLHSASGKPKLSVKGWALKTSRRKKIGQLTVSISHSADYAVATVILVGNKN